MELSFEDTVMLQYPLRLIAIKIILYLEYVASPESVYHTFARNVY